MPGAVSHPLFHSSKSSFHTPFSDEVATDTLVATDYKDPPTVSKEPDYIVRRLTPTECARLQGFPDWWCANLETEKPTDEERYFGIRYLKNGEMLRSLTQNQTHQSR